MIYTNQMLTFDFLNSIKDEELVKMIQSDVCETMNSIELCYNYEYSEFLKKHDNEDWSQFFMFDEISPKEFAEYINKRLKIQVHEVRYFEFIV